MQKQLYRIRSQAAIGGVCAGLAEYFSIDITLLRAIFVISFFLGGAGLFLYIILWIVLPEKEKSDPYIVENSTSEPMNKEEKDRKGSIIGGLVLITLGLIFLADELLPWFSFDKFWPLILVAIGIGLLWNSLGRKKKDQEGPN